MIKTKSILVILLPLCLAFFSTTSHARNAAILIDAESGKILNELEATQSWFPASLTKVMTLYLAFTALNQGQIDLRDQITVSPHAARQPNSKLGLRTGEHISVQEAILAIITRSANDAAVALGEHLGGNEENFAMKMTAKAHAIGMFDSHFMNATGLPHPWQVTTARDMGLLAWRTMHDFPQYYGYFGAHSFYFRGTELRGINKFTATYPGAEGMKTGFTCGSGYNLMSSASQNGKRLIGVILGGQTSPHRYQLMISMMNHGFAGDFTPSEKTITAIPVKTTGSAPYLLGCGNSSATHSSYDNDSSPSPVIHHLSNKHAKHSRHHRAVAPKTAPIISRHKPASHHAKTVKKAVAKSKPQKRHHH